MKEEKAYMRKRIGRLKKMSGEDKGKIKRRANEKRIQVEMPIFRGHHRFDPFSMWLKEKIEIREI